MKIKIGKGGWGVLGAGVFIILFFTLSSGYWGHAEEQDQLSQQITATQERSAKISLPTLLERQAGLNIQLNTLKTQTTDAKAALHQSTDPIRITRTLFDLADHNNIMIADVRSTEVTSQSIDKVPVQVVSLTIQVRGNVSGITEFITSLAEKFPTSMINVVNMSIPAEVNVLASAEIVVQIQSYEGD